MLVFVDKAQVRVRGRVGARRCGFGSKLNRHLGAALQYRRCAQRLPAGADALIGDEASGLSTRKSELVSEESI